MRKVVLILGILGGLAAAFLGFKWLSDYNESAELIELAESLGSDTGELSALRNAAYFLISGLLTGIIGGILTLKGNGKLGGPLMLISVVGAAVFAPKSLVFSCILGLAGILALVAKPPAATAQAA